MRKILFFILLVFPFLLSADPITNVRAMQEGKKIVLLYDLEKDAYIENVIMHIGSSEKRILPFACLDGDINKRIKQGKNKRIEYAILNDYTEGFSYDNVVFTIVAKKIPIDFFIMGNFGYSARPEYSGGLMFGVHKGYCGWYIKCRSNFDGYNKYCNNYKCNEFGEIYLGGHKYLPFYSGKSTFEIIVNTGVTINLACPFLYLYVGGGYGQRDVYWWLEHDRRPYSHYEANDYIGGVLNSVYSVLGFSSEVGLIGRIGKFTLSAGVNNINFQYVELEVGIGVIL